MFEFFSYYYISEHPYLVPTFIVTILIFMFFFIAFDVRFGVSMALKRTITSTYIVNNHNKTNMKE